MTRRFSSLLRNALAALALSAAGASAATLNQADLDGGQFSASVDAPTVVGAGYDTVQGQVSNAQVVSLMFSDLAAGAQELTFTFSLDTDVQGHGNGWAYHGAGGNLRYSIGAPFQGNSYTGGKRFANFSVDNKKNGSPTDTVTLSLDDDFSGALYVTINVTHGSMPIDFGLYAPSNAAPTGDELADLVDNGASPAPAPPIPLPSSAFLLIGGLGALSLRARLRKTA